MIGMSVSNDLPSEVVASLPDVRVSINCTFYKNLQKVAADYEV